MTIAIIRDDLSPDWSRICVENFPNNSSFRDMQRMTAIGERTNALARELNVAALGMNMTV